jgi:hypothetical protein
METKSGVLAERNLRHYGIPISESFQERSTMMEAQKPTESNAKGEPAVRHRRRRLWLLVPLIVLIVVVLAILIAVPAYLSSGSFRNMIQAKVGQATGGTLAIGNLSFGWFGGVRASRVQFQDAAGSTKVDVQGFDVRPHLGGLLGKPVSLGEAVIEKPTIEIDLRKRPPSPATPAKSSQTKSPQPSSGPTRLPFVGDMAIRDGAVRVTDSKGRTVNFASLNTTLNMRPAGETSKIVAKVNVSDTNRPGSVSANATVTPSRSEGWSLQGTSGQFTVEVNDLDLGSLNGLLELAGVKILTDGALSGNVQSTIDKGNVQNMVASFNGQSIRIRGPALNGDELRTSKLTVNTRMAEAAGALRIDQLQAQTDWATLTAAGTVPTGAKTIGQLVKSTTPLNLKGDFQCDLATVLSQMPKTLKLQPGMKFTAGKASGNINATTQNGMADLTAHAEVAALAGTVNGKTVSLSAPVVADARLRGDDKTTQIQTLNVTSSFAKVNATGDLSKLNYDGQFDLARLVTEAGQFFNFGKMRLAGTFAAKGQATMTDTVIGSTGTASIQQLLFSPGDSNSITEPSAEIRYAANMDKPTGVLTVTDTSIKASFGAINVPKATVPLKADSTAPLQANVALQAVDLKKLTGFGAALGYVPKDLDISGTANSQLTLSGQKDTYKVHTDSTTIDNLRVIAAGKKPFEQKQVAVTLDGQMGPTERTVALQLTSPQVKIKGNFKQVAQGANTTLNTNVQGQVDWAGIGNAASAFLPEGLELAGNKEVAVDLASTYPTKDPNSMPANLSGKVSTGIDGAKYMGMTIGPAKLDIGIQKGLLNIAAINTTLNKGQFDFAAAQANLRERPRLLRIPKVVAKGVQVDPIVAQTLLKNLNPLFANATAVQGTANLDCQQLVIPLEGGMGDKAALNGTFSSDSMTLEAAGLLTQILNALQQSARGQKLVIKPTNIVLKDGVVRYDNMEVDVGNNPINFGGAIGPKGKLNMTVTLPWTFQGRTERVGKEGQAGARVSVPLTGTVDRPELDLSKFLQQGLFKGLENLLQ